MTASQPPFDVAKLAAYLEIHIAGLKGPVKAEKFSGGQSNPTFLLTTPKGQYVLRRKPAGQLLKSAHAVDREYRVLKALADTDVPVAQVFHLCEDDEVIGSMFYVMSFVQGRIFWDPSLPKLSAEARAPLFDEVIQVLARLHNVNVDAVGLQDYGRPGNYFERQLGRWIKQYRMGETEHIEAMETLIEWLPNNLPEEDDQVSLIHGDYRLDNLIFEEQGSQVIAVLDWELSTLGHPLADLGYFCMCLRMPPIGHIKGLAGLNRLELGVPSEAEIIARYCELRQLDGIEHWNFYLAFSFFRLAAICQGVLKRALDGNASSDQALLVGKLTRPLAERAMELINEPDQRHITKA
jgi:aminoglycoside phosphotransferase (APT) family kinase protein